MRRIKTYADLHEALGDVSLTVLHTSDYRKLLRVARAAEKYRSAGFVTDEEVALTALDFALDALNKPVRK